jgi:hypothetical protein
MSATVNDVTISARLPLHAQLPQIHDPLSAAIQSKSFMTLTLAKAGELFA